MTPLDALSQKVLRPNETFVPIGKPAMSDKPAAPWFECGLWPIALKWAAPVCFSGFMAGIVYRIFVGG